MGQMEFKLSEILGRHRIKQRQLADLAGLRAATVNDFYHGRRERLELAQVAAILEAIEQLTGIRYNVGDLLEYRWAQGGERSQI